MLFDGRVIATPQSSSRWQSPAATRVRQSTFGSPRQASAAIVFATGQRLLSAASLPAGHYNSAAFLQRPNLLKFFGSQPKNPTQHRSSKV